MVNDIYLKGTDIMTHFQRVPIHTMARKWLGIFTMAQGKERDMTQRNHGTKKIGWHYET